MQSDFVNGHQILCDAHTVFEHYKGTTAILLYYSKIFLSFFLCFCHSDSAFFFYGVPSVYLNNLRGAELVL